MRCKSVQRLLIDATEGKLSPERSGSVAAHVASCERCADFERSLGALRQGMAAAPRPNLPRALEDETRERCWMELGRLKAGPAFPPLRPRRIPVPRMIWFVLPVLVALTAGVTGFGLQELADRTASLLSTTSLMLILQNTIMLVFAPILLRAWRRKHSSTLWNPGDAHVS